MIRYRVAYCAAFAAVILFYLFFNDYLSFFILLLFFLMTVFSALFTFIAVKKTSVTLSAEAPAVNKDEGFLLNILFQNSSVFPIARARVEICCLNSLGGEKEKKALFLPVNAGAGQIVQFQMESEYCGKITAELTAVKFYDYLGLFSFKRKIQACTEVFVLPKMQLIDIQIDTATNASTESNTYSKVKPGDDPSEIFDIRAFRGGDRPQRIHWKLSTKLDELMVKECSLPMDSEVLLLIDLLAPDMRILDALVEVLSTLSHFFNEIQMNHRIEWFDSKNNLFCEETIAEDEGLAILLNAVLSARGYQNEPYALACQNKLEEYAHNYPHAIYVTGGLTDELIEFCDRFNGEKTTILYICEETDEELERLHFDALNANIFRIHPGKIQECLSGVIL